MAAGCDVGTSSDALTIPLMPPPGRQGTFEYVEASQVQGGFQVSAPCLAGPTGPKLGHKGSLSQAERRWSGCSSSSRQGQSSSFLFLRSVWKLSRVTRLSPRGPDGGLRKSHGKQTISFHPLQSLNIPQDLAQAQPRSAAACVYCVYGGDADRDWGCSPSLDWNPPH